MHLVITGNSYYVITYIEQASREIGATLPARFNILDLGGSGGVTSV